MNHQELANIHLAITSYEGFEIFRHLTFSDDLTAPEAEKLAEAYIGKATSVRGRVFIERTGWNATINLNCQHCDAREQRQGFLFRL